MSKNIVMTESEKIWYKKGLDVGYNIGIDSESNSSYKKGRADELQRAKFIIRAKGETYRKRISSSEILNGSEIQLINAGIYDYEGIVLQELTTPQLKEKGSPRSPKERAARGSTDSAEPSGDKT